MKSQYVHLRTLSVTVYCYVKVNTFNCYGNYIIWREYAITLKYFRENNSLVTCIVKTSIWRKKCPFSLKDNDLFLSTVPFRYNECQTTGMIKKTNARKKDCLEENRHTPVSFAMAFKQEKWISSTARLTNELKNWILYSNDVLFMFSK